MSDLLLLFDIDGTLLQVREEVAFARAFRELYGDGVDLSFSADITASDISYITSVVQRVIGRVPTGAEVQRAVEGFVRHLADGVVSGELVVRTVAGAREFVQSCAGVGALAVATGCVEASARVKLRHAELGHHFSCGGYSIGETRRSEIVVRAIAAAERHYGRRFDLGQIVSFGDARWDVEAAHELGVRFVGVNESEQGRAHLARAGATIVVRDFSDPVAILRQIAALPA